MILAENLQLCGELPRLVVFEEKILWTDEVHEADRLKSMQEGYVNSISSIKKTLRRSPLDNACVILWRILFKHEMLLV